jgi:hypothetical protein
LQSLAVVVLRFHLALAGPLAVPPEKFANVFRGALGMSFADSGRRPYVLRVEGEGVSLILRVHLLGEAGVALRPVLEEAVSRIVETGLGPGRTEVRLSEVPVPEELIVPLAPLSKAPERIRVSFLTPTELKARGEIVTGAPFDALFARARDRVLHFAGGGVIRALTEQAALIRQVSEDLRHVDVERYSTRTGQRHGLGGFVGHAEYEGDFRALLPWLRAAEWTGVGRQTVWGKGHIRCDASAD